MNHDSFDLRHMPSLGKAMVLLFMLLLPLTALAQVKVTGTVTDGSSGEPIIGVTVKIKGGTTGAVTDLDGNYSVNAKPGQTLEFSYVGYATLTAKVPASGRLNVTMSEDAQTLNDIVVVGYGVMKRSDLTGSVASINEDAIKQGVNTSLEQAMQGRIAGVQVMQNSGAPGGGISVQIRGINTLNGNEPLYVIDGIATSGNTSGSSSVLASINPSDITSIEVLKDASATAIYGSRAANGVVVIETKSPQAGKLRLNYYGSVDMEVADLSDYHLLNAREKLQYEELAGLYKGSDAVYVQEEYLKSYNERLKLVAQGYDTDWLAKPLKSVGISQKHTMQLDGGNDSFRYGLSLNYLMNAGVMKGSDRSRLGTSLNLLYNYRNLRFRNELSYGKVTSNNSPYGPFSAYTYLNPYYYPYDGSGNLKQVLFDNYTPARGSSQVANPMYNSRLNTTSLTISAWSGTSSKACG